MLPFSTRDGKGATFFNALFTATSASCVTGLVVRDTGTYWTLFGQIVILTMIQIGGLGVVTMALAISHASGRRIGLRARSVMQDAISAPTVGGIIRMLKFITRWTLIFELGGMVLLSPVFIKKLGFFKGIWYSLFHSISAFCNAGFDLMGIDGEFSSLTGFATHPLVVLVVTALIIIGGIGFLVWYDVKLHGLKLKRYRMQSKVVLYTSLVLLIIPAVTFFFMEFTDGPVAERISLSWFQSVTTRTAGFNTADLTTLTEAGTALMIVLMLVGGSPGSTAGGMKTTTFAVLIANMKSVFLRREDSQFFGRRIPKESVRNAATILTLYCILFLTGGAIICRIEHIPLITCLFETASAVGTVGLTMGITTSLGTVSHLILILLMFLGRVGGLTIVFAAVSARKDVFAKYPQDKITVG